MVLYNGSFFGPSQRVLSSRVIRLSKPLVENHTEATVGDPKIDAKLKSQMLRKSRDYSFLFSEEIPLPTPTKKEETTQKEVQKEFSAPVVTTSLAPKQQRKELSPLLKKVKISLAPKQQRKELPPLKKVKAKRNQDEDELPPPLKKVKAKRNEEEDDLPPPLKQVKARRNEDEEAIAEIRKMFRYGRTKYSAVDEDDNRDMVSTLFEIEREEKRSAKIARREDLRELHREEEERRERLRKKAEKKE